MKYKYIILFIILAVALVASGRFVLSRAQNNNASQEPDVVVPQDKEIVVDIESGMTFSTICETAGIGATLMNELLESSNDVYDLARLKVGKPIKFYFDPTGVDFKKLIYEIDTETELVIEKNAENLWQARVQDIDYEVKLRTVEGIIYSSLYQSAIDQDLDIRAIIDLADIFAWTIDFGVGIREGDTYKFIFEERYRNSEYVMPGKIIAARFVNDSREVEGFYFSEGQDQYGELIEGYFHPDGASVQKLFLKNPVNFRYISSGFTTGPRYVSEFKQYTSSHRAIDYAAAAGTPVQTVGDGTVVYAGWNSQGYGNFVSIRHNETYTTNYAHLSKIYVSYGEHVSQTDIIGTVGSTGYSTGPHLHYEMVKNGTKINPLTVELPSDKAVLPENLESFKAEVAKWQDKLK